MSNGRLEGRRLKVFYDDCGSVSFKIGICTYDGETEIELDSNIVLLKNRIVRIEVISRG